MKFTIAGSDCVRVISDQLSQSDLTIVFQSNEYINQNTLILSRDQAEDLVKKIVDKLPHAEELVQQLMLISRGKRI